jgi:hypothetical protein
MTWTIVSRENHAVVAFADVPVMREGNARTVATTTQLDVNYNKL